MSVFSELKNKVTQYIDVNVKLFKINFIGRTANLLSYFMFALIAMLVAFCIILFLGFGLVESFILLGLTKVASFFITIGIYFLSLLVIVGFRGKITRFFASGIIRVMTEGDEEEKEETN